MKPSKPSEDYPLTPHRNGQFCKKIKGKIHYFGTDPDKALTKYLAEKDYLQAGQAPPQEFTTLGEILDAFMGAKTVAFETGEINARTLKEYEAVCDIIAASIGTYRGVDALAFADFAKLRQKLSMKKNGEPASPVSFKRLLTFARMPFHFANEELGTSIRYKKALKTPAARIIREAKNAAGKRLFTAEEIRKITAAARPEMRSIILLGINCAFGPDDCCRLPIEDLDLENGWSNFGRHKTGMARRAALWPGTIAALKEVIGERTEGPVFASTWNRHVIGRVFKAGCMGCEIYREGITTHYSLRRTFETVATASEVPQAVIDTVMGHAPDGADMAAVYRQTVFDDMLRKCANYVRDWVRGEIVLA